jgi:hypothetical protein
LLQNSGKSVGIFQERLWLKNCCFANDDDDDDDDDDINIKIY